MDWLLAAALGFMLIAGLIEAWWQAYATAVGK